MPEASVEPVEDFRRRLHPWLDDNVPRAKRPGWGSIKAVQETKVFTFDDNLVSRPGPRLVDGLETIYKILHP